MSDNEFDEDDFDFEDKSVSKEGNLVASGYVKQIDKEQDKIKDIKVLLIQGQWRDLYDNNFFGELNFGGLLLDPEEAILLNERGRIKIFSDESLENELSIEAYVDLISAIQRDFWKKYIVYKDLRGRGYVVRAGYGELATYRRYPRGAKPNKAQSDTFIYPFAEGSHLELSQLDMIVKQAQSNRKILILGMVDRSGDVTYYKASEFQIPLNTEKYEFPEDNSDKKDNTKPKRIDFNKN